MQNEIDPRVQTLLDELTKDSYLVRLKEIVKLLEPDLDTVIPLLLERLEDRSDTYQIRHNAIKVLALSADPRTVLPLIRHIEIETGWADTVFDYFRQGLAEKDDDTRHQVNRQLIRYLEEGPILPTPEPFDPAAAENSFDDFLGALMKASGVTELDEEARELAGEAKQIWVQPRDRTDEQKNYARNIQEILVGAIETLSAFDGLGDPRVGTLLSRYIKEYGFDTHAGQHAFTALSKIEPAQAAARLDELAASSPPPKDTTLKRVVGPRPGDEADSEVFTICVRDPGAEPWKEDAYYFIHQHGKVFLFARGPEIEKWFVGQASSPDDAVRVAADYLGRWKHEIDSQARIQDRYAECLQVVRQFIDFEKSGFHQTYIGQVYDYPYERPQIIYDSQWCRVKLSFRSYGEMYDQSDVLNILYGRLHAADRENTILWNGEPHHCWHDVSLALCFLDGMPPEAAAKYLWSHPFMAEYKSAGSGPQPEVEAGMHAAIWERYGERLFQLFDLRRPDLWEKYSLFVKHVYEIRGFNRYGVPDEKIC